MKLGFLSRFSSISVMVGFLTGIAIIIILSQLGDFTGFSGEGNNKVSQTLDLVRNFSQIDLATLAVGLVTLVLIVLLDCTRLSPVGMLMARVVSAIMVSYWAWTRFPWLGILPRSHSRFPGWPYLS